MSSRAALFGLLALSLMTVPAPPQEPETRRIRPIPRPSKALLNATVSVGALIAALNAPLNAPLKAVKNAWYGAVDAARDPMDVLFGDRRSDPYGTIVIRFDEARHHARDLDRVFIPRRSGTNKVRPVQNYRFG